MVLPARIERATYSLGGSRSIQLSYESTCSLHSYNRTALRDDFNRRYSKSRAIFPSFTSQRAEKSIA